MARSSHKQVLIVDDDHAVRMALRMVLESQGYCCDEVSDGTEALARLATAEFDLVMTDYQMPGMDGLQLLERLSESDGRPAQPVILHSGCLNDMVMRRARSAGAYGFLEKPFSATDVLRAVARAIEPP